MDQENITNIIVLLNKVYNTLFLISTKGTETLYMAKCLEALEEIINFMNNNNYTQETISIPIDEIPEVKEE